MHYFTTLSTPVGSLSISEKEGKLISIDFHDTAYGVEVPSPEVTPLLQEAEKQLHAYFAGKLKSFDLPILAEGTAFQKKCWEILRTIPYGTTISYKEEAELLGDKRYCRAVGMANGRNPLPIIIPCHRVINSGGNIGGYSSGIEIKKTLLRIEGVTLYE